MAELQRSVRRARSIPASTCSAKLASRGGRKAARADRSADAEQARRYKGSAAGGICRELPSGASRDLRVAHEHSRSAVVDNARSGPAAHQARPPRIPVCASRGNQAEIANRDRGRYSCTTIVTSEVVNPDNTPVGGRVV